jgi:galactose mutarotase-like enzyme
VRVHIGNSQLRAEISTRGAELVRLQDETGQDLLWDADPAYWPEHAPLLFPIVGRVKNNRARVDDREYGMPLHGFARAMEFAAEDIFDERCTFSLAASDTTLRHYPFPFRLTIGYRIVQSTLEVTACISNEGETVLPASFGFHPGFRWPLPYGGDRNEHEIRFQHTEPAPIRRLHQGLLGQDKHATPIKDRRLTLRDDLFQANAIIWDELRSQQVDYGAPGGRSVRISFSGMPHLGVWTVPGAEFICIEPWHGFSSPDGFDGELKDKPGTFLVPPKGSRRFAMQVTLLEASADTF